MSSASEPIDVVGPGIGTESGKHARPEKVIEAIQRPEQRDRYPSYVSGAAGMLSPFNLPGFGETQEDCGEPITFFCDSCYRMETKGRTCKQPTCKRCAAAWCRDRAENAVAYLKALKYQRYYETERDQHWHHVVISPPKDWELTCNDPYERTWDVVKEICEELCLVGYAGYHGWSGGDDILDDRGEWKDRLFEGREWEDDVKQELKARPHFHVVGVSDHVKGDGLTDVVNEETGWLIRRITNSTDLHSIEDNLEDLAGVTSYVISHTSIKETEAGNMSAQWRNIGFQESEIDVYQSTREEARAAVRSVAGKTLGIPSADMQCDAEVPTEDDADEDLDFDAGSNPLSGGHGGGGASEDWVGDNGDSVEVEPCNGSLLIISKAPQYIYDRRRDHPRLDILKIKYEKLKESEDWIG